MKKFYDVPTMVSFRDPDCEDAETIEDIHYLGGIAYKDFVICCCCGGVFELTELYEARFTFDGESYDVDFQELEWMNISEVMLY